MRLLISLILLFSFSPYVGALTSLDRAELSFPNSLQDSNPGFESGAVKWTATPAITINSTAADQFITGSKQFAIWDSTSSGQEICSELKKVPESGNCAVSLTYKVPSGTATHKIVAKDGSNDLAVEDVVSSTAAWRHDVEFPCAAAASNQARVCLRSVASNEPAIQLDGGYAGYARNVGTVQQARLVADAYKAGTASCGWSRANTAIGDFGTDADCPAITVVTNGGVCSITTTDDDLPQIVLTNCPAGNYQVSATFSGSFSTGTPVLTYALSDGTTTSGVVGLTTDGSVTPNVSLIGSFSYTDAGSRTFRVQGAASANSVLIDNTSSARNRLSFVVYYFPTSQQSVVTPNQQRTPRVVMYTSGSGTYIPSPGVTYIEVYARGGGGGAGGGSTGGTGTAGGSTSFGSLTIGGGEPGSASDGGFPGTVSGTLPSGGSWLHPSLQQGGTGNPGAYVTGGNGGGAEYTCPGKGRAANSAQGGCSGGGGGAGGGTSSASVYGGGGGGAGGTAHFLVSAPAGSYSFSIGAGGAAASSGSSVYSGSNGSGGFIRIVEHFGYTTAILANSVRTLDSPSAVINTIATPTTTYTATLNEDTIFATMSSGAWSLGLPPAATARGKQYKIVIASGGDLLTIDPNASETICGYSTIAMRGQGDSITIASNGSGWMALDGGCFRTIHASVTGANCTSSPCALTYNTVGTSITRSTTGTYAFNFNGTLRSSVTPTCGCGSNLGSFSGGVCFGGNTTGTEHPMYFRNTADSLFDNRPMVTCIGHR